MVPNRRFKVVYLEVRFTTTLFEGEGTELASAVMKLPKQDFQRGWHHLPSPCEARQ